MEKTLLYEALSSLSPAELREFGKFVRSPFFNLKPQLVALFDYFHQCRENGEKPDTEQAYSALERAIVPSPKGRKRHKAPDADQKLRLANSSLLALLEKYLAYKEKFEDADRAKIRVAAAYRKRNLGKHFQIVWREARQGRERLPWRHADYFHDLNLLEWEQYQFIAATQRTVPLNLQEVSDQMDTAFIARKLRLACAALSHQVVFNTEYKVGMLDMILQYVEAENLVQIPTVGLYFYCYKFLTEAESDAHFERFREMLFAHAELFPPDELRSFYLLAINFGIKKINESAEGWLRATLDLYKSALERDLLLENERLSRFAFNNIVAIALRTGELDWAEQFILQYKPRLERQWREVTASLNLARVAYARRDFKAALLNLQRSDYKDLFNNLTAKTLQLKIYYETSEYALLESHLSSMQNFIRRHAGIGYYRTNYGRIVHFTRQLMTLNFSNTKATAALREQIEKEEVLTEKEWFLEMLDL
jgi:hypothetical protein